MLLWMAHLNTQERKWACKIFAVWIWTYWGGFPDGTGLRAQLKDEKKRKDGPSVPDCQVSSRWLFIIIIIISLYNSCSDSPAVKTASRIKKKKMLTSSISLVNSLTKGSWAFSLKRGQSQRSQSSRFPGHILQGACRWPCKLRSETIQPESSVSHTVSTLGKLSILSTPQFPRALMGIITVSIS